MASHPPAKTRSEFSLVWFLVAAITGFAAVPGLFYLFISYVRWRNLFDYRNLELDALLVAAKVFLFAVLIVGILITVATVVLRRRRREVGWGALTGVFGFLALGCGLTLISGLTRGVL
jgi:hypothetical protein